MMERDANYYMRMCASCALHIHGATPQSYEYAANRTRRLLFMTGAHESGQWRWRRQHGFSEYSDGGAFGLWQCELGSIEASVRAIARNTWLRNNVELWLNTWGSDVIDPSEYSAAQILLALQRPEGDALSCLLARLHYFRVPEPFPRGLADLAKYAKRYYNTHLGSATWENYRDAYERGWVNG